MKDFEKMQSGWILSSNINIEETKMEYKRRYSRKFWKEFAISNLTTDISFITPYFIKIDDRSFPIEFSSS